MHRLLPMVSYRRHLQILFLFFGGCPAGGVRYDNFHPGSTYPLFNIKIDIIVRVIPEDAYFHRRWEWANLLPRTSRLEVGQVFSAVAVHDHLHFGPEELYYLHHC